MNEDGYKDRLTVEQFEVTRRKATQKLSMMLGAAGQVSGMQ